MAFQPQLTSYLRSIPAKNVRYFAAAAKPKEAGAAAINIAGDDPIKTSSEHGVTVSTQERNKPLAMITVTYKAGSRHETDNTAGLAHTLRIAAGLGTHGVSRFGLARNIEHHGGNFSCTSGREYISYTIEATRNKIENLAQILVDATSKQAFKHWEIQDTLPRQQYELRALTNEVKVLELLHRAAFRKGLGNSLYSPKYAVGHYATDQLQDFVTRNFVEASVVGIDVDHDLASKIAKKLKIKSVERPVSASKFNADQIRKHKGGDAAYVALGLQGAGFNSQREALAAAVASRALGSGARAKRGNTAGKLASVNTDNSVVSAFSHSYSDAGILGVFIVAEPNAAGTVTKKAADILRNSSFSEEDIKRAKSVLKADIGSSLETNHGRLEDMALQSLFFGNVTTFEELSKQIDGLSAADVNNLIKKGAGKLALATVGNVGQVPYLDEL